MNLVERLYRSSAISCDDELASRLGLQTLFERFDWGESCLQMYTRPYANSFCWFIPNDELIKYVAEKPTLEIMGGTGYFADLVRKVGGDIICTDVSIEAEPFRVGCGFDEEPLVKDVLVERSPHLEKLEASAAVKKYGKNRRLLIAWPPFGGDGADYEALKLFHKINPTAEVIFIGEDAGCATGTDEFHEYLNNQYQLIDKEIKISRWYGIYDRVCIYQSIKWADKIMNK